MESQLQEDNKNNAESSSFTWENDSAFEERRTSCFGGEGRTFTIIHTAIFT